MSPDLLTYERTFISADTITRVHVDTNECGDDYNDPEEIMREIREVFLLLRPQG